MNKARVSSLTLAKNQICFCVMLFHSLEEFYPQGMFSCGKEFVHPCVYAICVCIVLLMFSDIEQDKSR